MKWRAMAVTLLAGFSCAPTLQYHHPNHPEARILQMGEFIVPNNVFKAYFLTTTGYYHDGSIGGVYIHQDNLQGRIENFETYLNEEGFSSAEVACYTSIMRTPRHIVMPTFILNSPVFRDNLAHERFHREQDFLHPQEQETLEEAYDQLIKRELPLEEAALAGSEFNIACARYQGYSSIPLVLDADMLCWPQMKGLFRKLAEHNEGEFYPYLAQGKYVPHVERVLGNEFPEAYKIFDRIRRKTSIPIR